MCVLQHKLQSTVLQYRIWQNSSWCVWSASLWNTICPFVALQMKHKATECNFETVGGEIIIGHRRSERTRTGCRSFWPRDEKSPESSVCWDDDQRMKIEKQTNKQAQLSVGVWFFQRCKVPARSGATLTLAASPYSLSLWVSDPGSDAHSVLQFVSSKYKNWAQALTNLCTSYKAGYVFYSACFVSPPCWLFV